MGKPEEQYLTPAEAAKLTGLTPDALRARSKAGKLRFIRTVGSHRRYLRADVEAQITPGNGRRQGQSGPEARKGRKRGGIVQRRREQR